MKRRKLLSSLVALGVGSMAGCSAGGSDKEYKTQEGPPYFEHVSIEGPQNVTVGESFDLNVTAANTGGRSGNFSTTLKVGEDPLSVDESIVVPEIEPGYDKTSSVGPFELAFAGDFTFKITDHGAEYEVSVEPLEKSVGEAVTLWNDVEVSPRGVELYNAMTEALEEGDRLHFPEDGDFYAVAPVSVQNHDTEDQSLGHILSFEGLDELGSDVASHYSPTDFEELSGPDVGTIDAGAAERQNLVATAHREELAGEIVVIAQRDDQDSPPEVRWIDSPDQDTRPLPDFKLTSFEVPDEVEIEEEFEISAEVTNEGDAAATFKAQIRSQSDVDEPEGWFYHDTYSMELAPEESTTLSYTASEPLTGGSYYQIKPFSETKLIDFESAHVSIGSYFETAEGLRVAIDDVTAASSVDDGSSWTDPSEASAGMQWLLAHIVVNNDSDSSLDAPEMDHLAALSESEAFTTAEPPFMGDLGSPVEGEWYSSSLGLISSGERNSGWMLFEVPQEYSARDFSIEWEAPYDDGKFARHVLWDPMNA
ncbi:MAG: hypothetical protein ACOCUO_00420 [archaeon]